MQKRVVQHILTLFFTLTFLTPRIVGFCAFSHISDDDSPISCELCDTIAHYDQLDLMIGGSSYSEYGSRHIPSTKVVYNGYNSPKKKIVSPIFIYNKPPPII